MKGKSSPSKTREPFDQQKFNEQQKVKAKEHASDIRLVLSVAGLSLTESGEQTASRQRRSIKQSAIERMQYLSSSDLFVVSLVISSLARENFLAGKVQDKPARKRKAVRS